MTPIMLDRPRNFRFKMRALSSIEKKFGKPLAKLNLQECTIDDLTVIIWAGLVWEDPELTPERLMDIIDNADMSLEQILTMITTAMSEAYAGDKSRGEQAQGNSEGADAPE